MEHAPQGVIDGSGAQKTWSLPSRDLQDSKGNRLESISKLWSINFLELKKVFGHTYMYINVLICML